MATTLDDARIVLKIDTTQAEQAAEDFLRKRKGGGAPGGGGAGGGGRQPPGGGSGPSPADQPNPQDGGPGIGAQTVAALASGDIAGIPGLRLAVRTAQTVFFLEALQAVSGRFAGFFDENGNLIDKTARFLFEKLERTVGRLQEEVTFAIAGLVAIREGMESADAQAVLTGDLTDAGEFAVATVGIRAQLAGADRELRESVQKVRREMFGAAMRDKSEEVRDDLMRRLRNAFTQE